MSWFSDFFGGGVVKSIENIATEWIETDIEKAEAKSLMIKTLDPNGLMRRQISLTVSRLYSLYIVVVLFLIILKSFGVGGEDTTVAIDSITELFVPITSLFGIIVSASFGVNYMNIKKDK